MGKNARDLILFTTLIIAGIVITVYGLIHAKQFLIPVALAILLAMVMLPVDKKLRNWGISRVFSALFSDLLIVLLIIIIFFVVGIQVKGIIEEWPAYEEKLMPKIERVQQYIEDKTGIAPKEQLDKAKSSISGNGENGAQAESGAISGLFSSLGNFFLIFVYMFFFLFFRDKFKKSILNFVPKEHKGEAEDVLHNFTTVSQKSSMVFTTVINCLKSTGLVI